MTPTSTFLSIKIPRARAGPDFMGAYAVLEEAIPARQISYTTRQGIVDCYRPNVEPGAVRIC